MSSMSSDLSSQQIVINQMKNKIKNFESFVKSRENVLNVFQSKFNELKSEHKSKELTLETSFESRQNRIAMETREVSASHNSGSEMKNREELRFRGKLLLLKRQLRHSLALIERQKGEKESIERVLQELKDNWIEKKRVDNKVYAKDSMDRFGDDLTEEVLQYLTSEDKIRLECVSKQWQRCVYQRQYVIRIDYFGDEEQRNLLNGVIFVFNNFLRLLNEEYFESVLKKCPNIKKVIILNISTESEDLSLIGLYCHRIKSLTFLINFVEDLSFFRMYGHKLEELGLFGDNIEMHQILSFCPNLKKVFIFGNFNLITENKDFLPKLERIYQNFYSKDLNQMKILSDKYSQTMKTLNIELNDVTIKELKTCIECIARFENLKELKIEIKTVKTIQPIDDCLSLIGQKCNKLLKLDLNIAQSVPISYRFFYIFSKVQSNSKTDNSFIKQYSIVWKCRMFQTLQTTQTFGH